MEDIEVDLQEQGDHTWWRIEKDDDGWHVVGQWVDGELDTDHGHGFWGNEDEQLTKNVWVDEDGQHYDFTKNKQGDIVLDEGPGMGGGGGGGGAGGAAGAAAGAEGAAEEAEEAVEGIVTLPINILEALNPFSGSGGGMGGILKVMVYILLIGGLVIAGSFSAFGMYGDTLASEYGIDNPREVITKPATAAIQRTTKVAGQVKTSMMTQFLYRPTCQAKAFEQDKTDQDLWMRNCIRKKQGKEPIQRNDTVEESFNVQNYLSIETETEVKKGDALLRQECGNVCGKIEATFVNNGDQAILIDSVKMFLEGDEQGMSKIPMVLGSDYASSSECTGKQYEIPCMIEKTNVLKDMKTSSDLASGLGSVDDPDNQKPFVLPPDSEFTFTFLANITPYRTYGRSCVVSELKKAKERRASEDKSLSEQCGSSSKIYSGSKVNITGGLSSSCVNCEAFSGFSGAVCKSDVKEIARDCTTEVFEEEEGYTAKIMANYTSRTSSTINVRVTNINYWASLDQEYEGITDNDEAQDQFVSENCRSIFADSDLEKQVSEPYPLESAVGLLMYTDCEVHYRPNPPDSDFANRARVILSPRGAEEAGVQGFRIERTQGISNICVSSNQVIEEGHMSVYENPSGGWYGPAERGWTAPDASCMMELPSTPTIATKSVTLTSVYMAMTAGTAELNTIS